jgi:glycopeptide antibiotics resistance protein
MIPFFPYPFLTGLSILIITLLAFRRRGWRYLTGLALFGAYILALAAVVFFPLYLPSAQSNGQELLLVLRRVNLIPFYFGDLFSMPPVYALHEIGGNLLLTLPFGFFLAHLTHMTWRKMLWAASGVGLGMELVQLIVSIFVGRHSIDINDVILNAAGALIGYGLYQVWRGYRQVRLTRWARL